MARVTVVDHTALADTAAERITQLIEQSIATRGRALVSLTGGHTPDETYAALADPTKPFRQRIDWSRVDLYWGDERHVPPDHPDSNFGMANRTLVQQVPIPPNRVHRIHAEHADARQAAAEYERELPDVFDVMLLGLGEDCHIASIFPGSELLAPWHAGAGDTPRVSNNVRVAAVYAPHLHAWRITLTPAVILESRAIVMLVAGAQKADAVAAALDAPRDVNRYPGQLLRDANSRVEWFIDTAAAASRE